jgi:hypothetical protein
LLLHGSNFRVLIRDQLILRDWALKTIEGIKGNILTKDYTGYGPSNTTGKTAASIGYEWTGNRLDIFTTSGKSLRALEVGRPPTMGDGDGSMRLSIYQWVKAKGIETDDKAAMSAAFAISKRIHEKGTIIWQRYGQNGGNTGVVTDFVNEQTIAEVVRDLGTFVYEQLNQRFQKV